MVVTAVTVVGSPGSGPTTNDSRNAASATVRLSSPVVSKENARGTTPCRLVKPNVGRMPTMPFTLAGMRKLPIVSLPVAIGRAWAPTIEPEPPLLPPGIRLVSQGLRVGGVDAPKANS